MAFKNITVAVEYQLPKAFYSARYLTCSRAFSGDLLAANGRLRLVYSGRFTQEALEWLVCSIDQIRRHVRVWRRSK